MKHPWLTMGAVGGLALTLGAGSLGVTLAGAAPKPHSDQVITVAKTSAKTGAPLAGAVFTLYRWHGSPDLSSVVATATSDSTGHAVFSLVGHHNYWVVETAAPSGYTLPASNGVLVKTSHQVNGKGQDDRANLKEAETVAFADQPTGSHDTPPDTTPPVTTPPTGTGGVTSGGSTSPAAGSVVPGATTVHTGMAWAGSTPYVLGAGALGMALFGSGLLLRRRQLHTMTS